MNITYYHKFLCYTIAIHRHAYDLNELYCVYLCVSRIWSYVSQHFLRCEFTTDTVCYYRMHVQMDGFRKKMQKNF